MAWVIIDALCIYSRRYFIALNSYFCLLIFINCLFYPSFHSHVPEILRINSDSQEMKFFSSIPAQNIFFKKENKYEKIVLRAFTQLRSLIYLILSEGFLQFYYSSPYNNLYNAYFLGCLTKYNSDSMYKKNIDSIYDTHSFHNKSTFHNKNPILLLS